MGEADDVLPGSMKITAMDMKMNRMKRARAGIWDTKSDAMFSDVSTNHCNICPATPVASSVTPNTKIRKAMKPLTWHST